ncbi:MAG: aminotransferase class V-fold PLP-dependent enzyme, partial [Pseudohongiella sp.]
MSNVQSRRRFLRTSGALLLGAASVQVKLAQAQQDISEIFAAGSGEDYWLSVRNQFSFADDAVPMNAANLCPSFRIVAQHVAAMTADIDQDCSFNNRARFSGFLEDARSRVAAQLNISADEVALVRNTSEANNIVNNGLALERGDEVVVWDENHPTNNVAWDVRAARFGFVVKKVATPAHIDPGQLVDAFVRQFTDRTRVLALTQVSNVSGIKLPVAELVAAAHKRGIFVHLDGAQTWGAMNLDLQALGVDAFTASAHKWF